MKMKKALLLTLILLAAFISCSKKTREMREGIWRGVVFTDSTNRSLEIPFNFFVNKDKEGKKEIIITNADEKIKVSEIEYKDDSVIIKMPVFKDEIRAKLIKDDSLKGEYHHYGSRSYYTMPFFASAGNKERFLTDGKPPAADLSGRWETTLNPGDSTQETIIGEFSQSGSRLTGTFLSVSGDYRYLEGTVSGSNMMLSCFDGTHTILFKAEISSDGKLINGILSGGPKWKNKWTAFRNPDIKLPPHDNITKLKEGVTDISFCFPDLNNNKVCLDDGKFRNKAVIVQILGSWCPNCMDETKLFNELYEKYNPQGLEIIGLCFETNNFDESVKRINRFREQLNSKYTFLYAGEVGRKTAADALPFIEKINGYPTSIFLDRNHKPVKVLTGFSGPGTGKHYENLKDEITGMIKEMLK